MKNVYVFLAEGFEEVEAVTTIDYLRRGGFEVKVVSTTGFWRVTGSHNIILYADMLFDAIVDSEVDVIVLPGGMPGTLNLAAHEGLRRLILLMQKQNKPICAICAAPMILGKLGLLEGKKATIYPGMEEHLIGAKHSNDTVCVDGNIITSRAASTAVDFALTIIETLDCKETADKVSKGILHS